MAKKEDEGNGATGLICQILECLITRRKEAKASKFVEHMRNAHVEVLMAVRSLVDSHIEAVKAEPKAKPEPRRIQVKGKK